MDTSTYILRERGEGEMSSDRSNIVALLKSQLQRKQKAYAELEQENKALRWERGQYYFLFLLFLKNRDYFFFHPLKHLLFEWKLH